MIYLALARKETVSWRLQLAADLLPEQILHWLIPFLFFLHGIKKSLVFVMIIHHANRVQLNIFQAYSSLLSQLVWHIIFLVGQLSKISSYYLNPEAAQQPCSDKEDG